MRNFTILLMVLTIFFENITAQQVPDLKRGLIVYYPLNGNTSDESDNEHHGTANGISSTINRFDEPNSASAFNGVENSLSFAGIQLQSSNITICGWLMVTDEDADTVFKYVTPADNMFLLRVVNHNYQVEIHLKGANKIVFPNRSGIYEIDVSHPRFDFLFLSFIGNQLTFGINNLSMRETLDDQVIRTTFPYTIKNNPVVNAIGIFDEIRIYNRALNDEERTILYFAEPRYTSFSIKEITQKSVTVESILTTLGGPTIIERGIRWDTTPDMDSLSHKVIVNADTGRILTTITGLKPFTTYYLKAYVKSSNREYDNPQTLKFTTLRDTSGATLTDIDGNHYQTVKIGTQTWMAENLKTTRYADGTPIPLITNNSHWISFSSGAYCWYNNDSAANANKYGALYNWYTVNTDKLCPIDWKVPSDNDWRILENYLIKNGFNYDNTLTKNKIAKSLSSAFDWSASDSEGVIGNADYPTKRNITDFTALPGGFRNYMDGRFVNQGQYACFWTTTENEIYTSSAWYRLLYYDAIDLRRQYFEKTDGFSVRCLKQEQDSTDFIDLYKGLIAYYPFNGNANDESGFYHHGTVNGTTLTGDRFDNPNSAYYFNGQGNSISVNSLNVPSTITTISCWVKNNTAYGLQNYISKHDDSDNVELLVRSVDNRYTIEWTIGSSYFVLSDSEGLFTIDPENPRFDLLVLVYDGTQVRFYVNSVLIASHDISGQIANNDVPMVFGRYAGHYDIDEFFNGTLDEVRIYNRALNEKEINALYDIELSASSSLGDIDFNHHIDSSDASLALQYSVGLDPLPSIDPLPWESVRVTTADVDNQDGITAYDASLILQKAAGLINTFPAEDIKKSFTSPQADIDIALENGYVTFRPKGELYGFNLSVSSSGLLGTPQVIDRNLLSAVNITNDNYSIGLATAYKPKENDIILKIPVLKIPDKQITASMKINNEEKQLSLATPTNIVTEGLEHVEFYPNPTSTIIYFNHLGSEVLVTMYDLHGKKVIESYITNGQLDVSALPAGIYFVKLRDKDNTIIRKLIKQQ